MGIEMILDLIKHDKAAGAKYFQMLITKVGFVEKAEMNEEFFKATFPNKRN